MRKFYRKLPIAIACGLVSLANASTQCNYTYNPYHEMTINMSGGNPRDLVQVSQTTGIQNYTLAFVIDRGSCNPAWDGQYTTSSQWGKSLTDRMRAAGIKYSVSFGGAAGNDISRSCSQQNLTAAYEQIITTYQPNGLDFDIENGSANVGKIMTSLKTIQLNYPNIKLSLTLPVMPEGLTSSGKSIVSQAKSAGLNFVVNIMAMDYGFSYRGDMGKYAVQAATNTFNYLKTQFPQKTDAEVWKMVGVTPMIGVNDTYGEKFTLSNADTLRTFAQQNGIYNISIWSLDRDKPCGGSRPSPTCSGGNVQSKVWEFSSHFLACNQSALPLVSPDPLTAKICQ